MTTTILGPVAETRGFPCLGAVSSVARREDRHDSDLDFLAEPREGADLFDLIHLEQALTAILVHSGVEITLKTYAHFYVEDSFAAMAKLSDHIDSYTEQIRNEVCRRARGSLREELLPCESLASGAASGN